MRRAVFDLKYGIASIGADLYWEASNDGVYLIGTEHDHLSKIQRIYLDMENVAELINLGESK